MQTRLQPAGSGRSVEAPHDIRWGTAMGRGDYIARGTRRLTVVGVLGLSPVYGPRSKGTRRN